jgi:chaperonin GroES
MKRKLFKELLASTKEAREHAQAHMKPCALIPLGDRVVIVPDEAPELKNGLVVLPSKWDQPTDRGTVVAAGLGDWDEDGERNPLTIEVGERVLFTRVRGMQVAIGERTFVLVRESELLATLP